MVRRVTEEPNPATDNIDALPAEGIVERLAFCDQEMFGPQTGDEKKLYDKKNLEEMEKLKTKIHEFHQNLNGKKAIILTGSGTSGRVAFLIAKKWNKIVNCDVTYLIAGGGRSLVMSQEAPEDDFDCGAKDLHQISKNYEEVLLIAISCAMSAPYAIGQLHLATSSPPITSTKFVSCMIGFNSTEYFKTTTKNQQIVDAVTNGDLILINPIVGPEAVTGSSRMKGGSMTKILLETLFISAMFTSETPTMVETLKIHQQVISEFYKRCGKFLANVVSAGGASLTSGSKILYFGSGFVGILGIIDSAECVPTYGAELDDVCGFVEGGFEKICGLQNENLKLGEKQFFETVENTKNLTILLAFDNNFTNSGFWKRLDEIFDKTSRSGDKIFLLTTKIDDEEIIPPYITEYCHLEVKSPQLQLPQQALSLLESSLFEICYKLAFNAVSTGSFILNGKVYHNMMVDMKLSNEKLFHRAIAIIQKFCGKSTKEEIKDAVLKTIYKTDLLNESQLGKTTQEHIEIAEALDKVIPCSIVMLKTECNLQQALSHLKKFHKIRDAVDSI